MKEKQTELNFDVKRQKTFSLEDIEVDAGIELNITFIDKQEELADALHWLSFSPKKIGVDIETRGLDPHQDEMIMFQFGDEYRQFVIDTRKVDITQVINYILVEDTTVVGQNLKFEYKFIKHKFGKNLINVQDTMIQEVCLYNGLQLKNDLKSLAKRYLNYEADKTIRMRFLEIGDAPFSKDEIIYGAYDVVLPLKIAKEQDKQIKEDNLETTVTLEHEYLKVLGDMEYKGLYFDKDKWLALYHKNLPLFEEKIKALNNFILENNYENFIEDQIDMFRDRECTIQWSSPTQVIKFFRYFDICPQAVSKTTKKLEYTVDAKAVKASLNTMNKDISKELKGFIKLYLDMKEYQVKTTTFGIDFFKYINPVTNRLHSNFRQIVSTGRSSSSAPNLQNIPSGADYRKCFTAPEGNKIINADYSGQETVVLANKALEPNMIKLINEGGDMHSFVASHIYDTPYEKYLEVIAKDKAGIALDPSDYKVLAERKFAKAAGFAIAYGGTGYTISKNLGITEELGDIVYNGYFKAFPDIQQYFDAVIAKTLEKGYILINDVTKRRLNLINYDKMKHLEARLPTLSKAKRSTYFSLKSQISRLSLNVPIQGTAGDITKNAAVRFRNWIYENKYEDKVFITNVIHDEINVECKTEISNIAAKALENCMEKAGNLWCKTVPLKADAQIKDYWTH